MRVLASDAFDRGNSSTSLGTADVGGVWAASIANSWGIQTNRAYCPLNSNGTIAVLTCTVPEIDTTIEVGVLGGFIGVLGRCIDGNNYYLAQVRGNGTVQLYKRVAGTFTQLGTDAVAALTSAGQVLGVRGRGSTISATVDGTPVMSVTDTAFSTSAFIGMYGAQAIDSEGNIKRFENFLATTPSANRIIRRPLNGLIAR